MAIKDILTALRIRQWVKNAFIFVPLLFSGKILNTGNILLTFECFVYFCLLSSVVYIVNDFIDLKGDRLHPVKSRRPIAAGRISFLNALALCCLLLLAAFSGITNMHIKYLGLVSSLYLLLNIAYSIFLKHSVILDVMCIAFGFELRIWAGAVIVGIAPSVWLQVYTFLLALFLGFAKRREEVVFLRAAAAGHRKVLADYRLLLLDQFLAICSGVIILAYALYTLSGEVSRRPGGSHMIYTVPFVVYGIFRYLYLVYVRKKGGDPAEIVYTDKPMLVNLLLWVSSIFIILYLGK